MPKQENKTIVMNTTGGGLRKVVCGKDYKITFGAVCPGTKYSGSTGAKGWCLRIYRTKEQPVAIFTDVETFFVEGEAEIRERRTQVHRRRMGREAPNGMENQVVEARMQKWVDPLDECDDDEDTNEFMDLIEAGDE